MTDQNIPNSIDFLCAIEKACLKCGDKHLPNCPVGRAKAPINSTNDLLIEFYNNR